MEAKVSPEEYRQLQRALMEKTLDRAASDPEWRQRLLEDPEAAMAESGFPETERLQEINRHLKPVDPEESEVEGHHHYYYYSVSYTPWVPHYHGHHHHTYRWTDDYWTD